MRPGAANDLPPSAAVSGTGSTNRVAKWLDGSGTLGDSSLFDNGYVGLGTTTPAAPLHLYANGINLRLESATQDEGARPKITFANNALAILQGDDHANQEFGFYSGFAFTRTNDAVIRVHGSTGGNWGTYLGLSHDGTDGSIWTDTGDIVLSPASNVGIGTTTPAQKLTVAGTIESTSGGIKFPDGTTQTTSARTRGITFIAGCDYCGVLADTYDNKAIYYNVIGAMTINSVTCFSDAGTPTINIQRDDGSPANILSSSLSCSTSGATTTSIVGGESTLNLNEKLDFVMVTAGGAAHRATVVIKTTVN